MLHRLRRIFRCALMVWWKLRFRDCNERACSDESAREKEEESELFLSEIAKTTTTTTSNVGQWETRRMQQQQKKANEKFSGSLLSIIDRTAASPHQNLPH